MIQSSLLFVTILLGSTLPVSYAEETLLSTMSRVTRALQGNGTGGNGTGGGGGTNPTPDPQPTWQPTSAPPPTNGTNSTFVPNPPPSLNITVMPACYVEYVQYAYSAVGPSTCLPTDNRLYSYYYTPESGSGSSGSCSLYTNSPTNTIYRRLGCNSSTFGGYFYFSTPTCEPSSLVSDYPFEPNPIMSDCNGGNTQRYVQGQPRAPTSGAELTMYTSNMTSCSSTSSSIRYESTDYYYITSTSSSNTCNGQESYSCSPTGAPIVVKNTYSGDKCSGSVISSMNMTSSSVCAGNIQLKCYGGLVPPPAPSPPPPPPPPQSLNITVMPACYMEMTTYKSGTCSAADVYYSSVSFSNFGSSVCTKMYDTPTYAVYGRLGCNSSSYGGQYMFTTPTCDPSSVIGFNANELNDKCNVGMGSGSFQSSMKQMYVQGQPRDIKSGAEISSFFTNLTSCSIDSRYGRIASTDYNFVTREISGFTCDGFDAYTCSPTGAPVVVKTTFSGDRCSGSVISSVNLTTSSVCAGTSQLKCYGGLTRPTFNVLPPCYMESSMYRSETCAASDKYATVYQSSECSLLPTSGSLPTYGRIGCNSSTVGGMYLFSSPSCDASSVISYNPNMISESCNNKQTAKFASSLPAPSTTGAELTIYQSSSTCSGVPSQFGVSSDYSFITSEIRSLTCNGTVAFSCSTTGAATVIRTTYSEFGCMGSVLSSVSLSSSECGGFNSGPSSGGSGPTSGGSNIPGSSRLNCYGGVSPPASNVTTAPSPSSRPTGTGGGGTGTGGGGTGTGGGTGGGSFNGPIMPLCFVETTMYRPSPVGGPSSCAASDKYATRYTMSGCNLLSNSSFPVWGRVGCNSSTVGGMYYFSSPTCDASTAHGFDSNLNLPLGCSNNELARFVPGQAPAATSGLEVTLFDTNVTTACSGEGYGRVVSTDYNFITDQARNRFCNGGTTYSCAPSGAGMIVKTIYEAPGCTGPILSTTNMTSSVCIDIGLLKCYGGITGGRRLDAIDINSRFLMPASTTAFNSHVAKLSSAFDLHSRFLQASTTSLRCVPLNSSTTVPQATTTPPASSLIPQATATRPASSSVPLPSITPSTIPRVVPPVLPICYIESNVYKSDLCIPSEILFTQTQFFAGCTKVADNVNVGSMNTSIYVRYGCNATHSGVFYFTNPFCTANSAISAGNPAVEVMPFPANKCTKDPTSPPGVGSSFWRNVPGRAPLVTRGLERTLFDSNSSSCTGLSLQRYNASDFYFITDSVRSLTCDGQDAYSCSPTGAGLVVKTRYSENGCFGSIISSTVLAQSDCAGNTQYRCYGVPLPNITCGRNQVARNGFCNCAPGFVANVSTTTTTTTPTSTAPLVCLPNCLATLNLRRNADNSGCECQTGYRPSASGVGCSLITCNVFEQLTSDFKCVCNRGFFKPANATFCTQTPKTIVVTNPVGGVVLSNVTNSIPPVPFAIIREGEKTAATFDVYLLESSIRFAAQSGDVINVTINLEPVSTSSFNPSAFDISPRMLTFSKSTPETQKVTVSASANLFAGDSSSIACKLQVQGTTRDVSFWAASSPGYVVFMSMDATPAKILIPSFDDKGRPSTSPAAFTITDGGADSSAVIPVSLTAIPPPGVTVALRVATSSLTVKTDKTTLFFTQSNWDIAQMVTVSADLTFATIAVSGPITISVSTTASYNGPAFEPASARVTLVRASSLAPRFWSPLRVTKGTTGNLFVALGNTPVSAVNASVFVDVSRAPINGPQIQLEVAEQSARFIIFNALNAVSNTSVAIMFSHNPYATSGEFIRVCLSMLGFQSCSSPIMLIDTVAPAISPIQFRNLFSGAWDTFLPDGVTLRIREGSSTLVNFSIATQIIGRLSASLSISSGFSFANPGTSQAFATATSNNVVLSITGRVQSVAVDPSFTNRTGNFTITIQPDTRSSTLIQDSGYANPPLRRVIPFVLINPGTATSTEKPVIRIEGPVGASFIEGDQRGLTINVTVTPPPSANTKVVLKVVAPSLTSASSYELVFTNNVTRVPITLTGLEDLIAFDIRTSRTFSFSVSDKTDSLEHLQLAEVMYSATMIDNDVPGFNISSTTHSLTEGGADSVFSLSLTASPPFGQRVTVLLSSATGACLPSPNSLLSLNLPCMKSSDCPVAAPFCRTTSNPMFSLVTALPQSVSFSSADWSVPQTITLRAPRDGLATGKDKKSFVNVAFAPTTTLTSFQVVKPTTITVNIAEVDVAGGSFLESSNSLFVEGSSNNAESRISSIRLNTVPLAPVTISASSTDPMFEIYSRFTTSIGSTTYSFSSGVKDDNVLRGNASNEFKYFVPIEFRLSSEDPAYNGTIIRGSRTIIDDERAGVDVSIPIGAVLEEGGSNVVVGSFTLTSQPVQDVVVTIVEVPSTGTFSNIVDTCANLPTTGSQLVTQTDGNIFKFTYKRMDAMWNQPILFTLSARADGRKDDNLTVAVVAQISSVDPNYNGLPFSTSSVRIVENDLVDPPALTDVTFDSSYDSLTATFNKKISADGTQFNCANLFQVSSAAPPATSVCKSRNDLKTETIVTNTKLGAGSYCTQISDTSVKIVLGSISRPSILSGDFVSVNYGIVRASPSAIRFSSGSVAVKDALTKPSPVVAFPLTEQKLDSCSSRLIGPAISGTGGRPFTLVWSARGANSALSSELALLNSRGLSSLFIDVNRLPTGSSVNITVTVTNWLNMRSSASMLVTRETAAKPKVELSETASYKRSETFSVSIASATLSTCGTITAASGLEFYWFDLTPGTPIGSSALYEGTASTALQALPFYSSASANGKYLKFSNNVRTATFSNVLALAAGTYRIGVFTLSKEDSSFTFKTQTITIVNDDLVATLENGIARSIDLGTSSASTNEVTFVATGSGEPTEILRLGQSGITFTWTTDCVVQSNCVLSTSSSTASLTNAVFSISSSVTEFTVTLTVSAPGRANVTASQKVKFSSIPIPTVTLTCTTMAAFGAVMPAIDNKFYAEASATGYSDFSFVWSAGSGSATFPDKVTKSSINFVSINPMEDLSEGSSYNLCVTATATTNPPVTSYSCFPFTTAAAPKVGPVTIILQNSASTGNTYSISTESLNSVVTSTSFAYLSTDMSEDYNVSSIAAGYTNAAEYVKILGVEESKMITVGSFDSAVSSFATTKIASGYHIVCVFGYNSAGSFDLSCASLVVPIITLTTDDQKNALSDALKGGDSENILSEIGFIIGNDQAKAGPNGRRLTSRHLQSQSLDALNTISIQSSMTADAVDAVLTTLSSVYNADVDTASGGQGGNLDSILNSLRSNVPALLNLGNSTLLSMCYSLAKKSMTSMNTLQANFITTGVLENAAFVLCACGSQLSCSEDVASLLASGSNAQKFSTSVSYTSGVSKPYFYISGSSGVLSARDSLSLLQNTFTVSASTVSQAVSTSNGYKTPSLVALYGSSIVGPSNAIAGTTPVEIRALGHSTRTSSDNTPVISVTMTGITVPEGKTVYAAYTNGATQAVSYSNAATSCTGTTCTIYSKSTSTYALVAEDACSVVVSSSDEYGAAALSTTSITEGTTKTLYVYLTRQPEASVTVAVSLKSGICYITDTNVMVTNEGYAVTCSSSTDCVGSSTQDCRSQVASLKTDPAGTASSSLSLTFTSSNYASSQSVFVTAVADSIFENEAAVQSALTLIPSSTDSRYDSVGVCTDSSCSSSVGNAGSTINVNIVDVDTASIIVSALSASSRTEGQSTSFTVRLSSKPKATVTVTVTETTSAVTFDVSSLSFTVNNWNTAQTVTVSVADDNLVNGARAVSIVSTAASSDDYFNGKTSTSALSITDNDVASVSFTTFAPANIDQAGDNAKTLTTIKLGAQPTDDVIVTISYTATYNTLLTASGSGVSGTAYASPITVTISPNNWNTGVTLTLTSESDGSLNPNAVVTLSMITSCSQSAFNGLQPSTSGTFTVINTNSGSVVPAMSSFSVSEAIAGGSSYTVSLSKATTDAVVTVSIEAEVPSSSFPYSAPFLISPTTLTWNLNDMSAQTVTVTPVNDNIAIPPGFYFFIVHNITSGPPSFVNSGAIKEIVSWTDDDTPAIVITPTAFTIVEYKDDNAAAFFLSLATQPATSVTISCSSPFAGAVLNQTSFVFTSVNFNIPQKVWVIHNGTIPHDMDGQHLITITAAVSAGDYAAPSLSVSAVTTVVTLPNPTPSPTPSVTPTPLPWNVSCQTGFYYSQTKTSCIACPGGKTSTPGDLTCSSCPAGTYSNPAGGVASCVVCPAGTYSSSGASSCTACSTGFYSIAGATVCTQCVACTGSQYQTSACSLTTNTVCQECASCTGNKYITTECSVNADAVCGTCKTCSASEYRVSSCSGKSDTVCSACSTCSANEYLKTACSATSNAVCSTCSTCASGQYKETSCSDTADTVCKACTTCDGATQYQVSACSATSDTVCADRNPDGTVSCAVGSYYDSAVPGCVFCPDGKTSAAGAQSASECSTCAAGTSSSPQVGASSSTCTNCTAGTYSEAGAASCTKCAVGEYSSAGSSSCSKCAPGKFSNTTGSTTCTDCAAGEYSALFGALSCDKCPAGTFSFSGATSCTNCAAGSYSSAGSSSCTKCKTCASDEYQSGGTCSATTDSITCKTCSTCSSPQVVETKCSATRDTVCSTKTSVPSSAVTPSPSAKASVNPAAPSVNPPRATEPVVQVVLSFSNIPESAFQSAAGIASLEASIAKAAKLDSKSTVKVARVYNLDTKSVIFTARRLANANLEVTTRITTDSVSSAAALGGTLKASATSFGASVLSDLKTKDAATFQSASISVSADSIAVPAAEKAADSSAGLSMGAIIGIAVGASLAVIGIFGGVGYILYTKFGAPATQEETASFEFQSPMLKSQTGQIVISRPEGAHKVIGRGSRGDPSNTDKVFKNVSASDSDSSSRQRNEFEPSSASNV